MTDLPELAPREAGFGSMVRESLGAVFRLPRLGQSGLALIAGVVLVGWAATAIYRVQPDEQGVVLRFGKWVDTAQPGLHFHWPYPIETVLLPKALRVSTLNIGVTLIEDPARRGRTKRDIPEESLMLTGDENIVDVEFAVLWRIKPNGAADYLFNI